MAYDLITIPSVELFQTGCHNEDCYDLDDLQEMVKNSQIIKQKPVVKIGHHDQQNFEWPSLGYVDRLRVVGNKLVGDLVDVPKKLGELIKAGAYGKRAGGRSAEIFWNFRDSNGRLFRRVFKAISLLGENWGAVSDLAPINLSGVEGLYARSNASCVGYDSRGQYFRRYEMPVKRSPESVNLRKGGDHGDWCTECTNYQHGQYTCKVVDGKMDYFHVCDLFDDHRKHEKKTEYTIKKFGSEFHVVTAGGLTMGKHDDLFAAERQRRELAAK